MSSSSTREKNSTHTIRFTPTRREREPVVLYATSACHVCESAGKTLDSLGIPYAKRLVDVDPEAQADALMLNIIRVPLS
nr:glutaredoxin domain-containing protein [Candidatus Sigynarchaeum springense]